MFSGVPKGNVVISPFSYANAYFQAKLTHAIHVIYVYFLLLIQLGLSRRLIFHLLPFSSENYFLGASYSFEPIVTYMDNVHWTYMVKKFDIINDKQSMQV